tara:strand:- start:2490 stop:3101 length:612 start_codon:yes stop_codon:yes gene_type:complete
MIDVCILDYGSGNVSSVFNLVDYLGYKVKISNKEKDLINSSHIILPGVGSFGGSMKKINSKIPTDLLKEQLFLKNKPFLGICVGMQVLSERGYEFGENDGLSIIKGSVEKLDCKNFPVPHIGWNEIKIQKQSELFKNMQEINDFYFVHSFEFKASDTNNIISTTNYGNDFVSAVQKENIFGVQFHPEKSQKAGQLLIKNFLNS